MRKPTGKPKNRRLAKIAAAVSVLAALFAAWGIRAWLFVDLPSPDRLYEHARAPSTRIYDRHGRLLYEITDPHGGLHNPVPLAEIPEYCKQATIATEDANFYANPGVDLVAIVRALYINLRGGEIISGGSTITQQLARNLLLSPEERAQVTMTRKLREAILAWRTARKYSKDEVLQLYMNEANYGNLAYGIESASNVYFGKSASELDLAECAMLAGLPQSPANYNPLENPNAARLRQEVVLGLMVKQGYITEEEAALAGAEKLGFAPIPFPIEAPHFVMYVRGQLEREFGPEAIYTQGLQVHTTLDLDMQDTALRVMRRRLAQLEEREGQRPRNVNNAGLVALDPRTGEILVMLGSPNYFDAQISGAVNATTATRQPGSSIKPITYAAAFDPGRAGGPLTPATMVMDTRTSFVTKEGAPYVPMNYDLRWRGPVLLREALANSYNLVAVKVLDEVGVDNMIDLARQMGITTFDNKDFGLALTLGGGEVRLVELVGAYAAFANGGTRVQPVAITRVEDSGGRVLKQWEQGPPERVMDARVAFLITDILSDDAARITSFGERSLLYIRRPAAAKTGTTTDWRDNWTVGYTPQLVAGVWVGNADNDPMKDVTGITGAAPIWHDFMIAMLKDTPAEEFEEPPGIVHLEVCADNGLLPSAGEGCPHRIREVFIEGTQPTEIDDWHRPLAIDTRNGLLAGEGCPPDFVVEEVYTFYPAEAEDWVRQNHVPTPPDTYSPLCPRTTAEEQKAAPPAGAITLTSPDNGGVYFLSPEIPAAEQQIRVAARPAEGARFEEVSLLADGETLATFRSPPYEVFWQMAPGTHVFSARGHIAGGETALSNPVTIEVVREIETGY